MAVKGYFTTLDAKVKPSGMSGQCQKVFKLRIILTALAGGKLFKLYFKMAVAEPPHRGPAGAHKTLNG